jgi:ribosome-binding ATPase YchF (GTP1/OBG family)
MVLRKKNTKLNGKIENALERASKEQDFDDLLDLIEKNPKAFSKETYALARLVVAFTIADEYCYECNWYADYGDEQSDAMGFLLKTFGIEF